MYVILFGTFYFEKSSKKINSLETLKLSTII